MCHVHCEDHNDDLHLDGGETREEDNPVELVFGLIRGFKTILRSLSGDRPFKSCRIAAAAVVEIDEAMPDELRRNGRAVLPSFDQDVLGEAVEIERSPRVDGGEERVDFAP